MCKNLLIGVGNSFRRDDAVGIIVASALRDHGIPGVDVLESTGDGAELLDIWQGKEIVVLVDAMQSGSRPGTIRRLEPLVSAVPTALFPRCSSHLFSIGEAVEMGTALGQLPKQLVIYGVEGKNFSDGCGLSEEACLAAEELVERLCTNYP